MTSNKQSTEEILLEGKVSDILINIFDELEIVPDMTTSDFQGYLQVKAMDIIKLVREAK